MDIWIVNENEDRTRGRGPMSETGAYTDFDFALADIRPLDPASSGVTIVKVQADIIPNTRRLGLDGEKVWGEFTDVLGNKHVGTLGDRPIPRLGSEDLERLRELDKRYGELWREEEQKAINERFDAAEKRAEYAPRNQEMLLAYHGTGPGHPTAMLAAVFTNTKDADQAIRSWRESHPEEPLISLYRGRFNTRFHRRQTATAKPVWREVQSDFAEYRRLLKRARILA